MPPPSTSRWLQLDDPTFASYNCWDTYATALLARTMPEHLRRNGQLEDYQREVWSQLPAVLAMQARGIPYSTKRKSKYRKALRRELRQTDAELRKLREQTGHFGHAIAASAWQLVAWLLLPGLPGWFGTPASKVLKSGQVKMRPQPFTKGEWAKLMPHFPQTFNPNSDAQKRRWLFTDLGLLPRGKRTDGGLPSVNQDALNRILQHLRVKDRKAGAEPILWGLMHRARLQKIDQDYLDPEVREGRVYPTIKMLGTETGRFAYADPPVHSWPDEVRHLMATDEDHLIISADYSAIESRVFAYLTDDQIDLEIFERNRKDPADPEWDIHIRTACSMFGWSLSEFLAFPKEKQKASRNTAKTFRYGVIQYGGDPTTAQTKVFCPCPKCRDKAPPTLALTAGQKRIQAARWFNQHRTVLPWRAKVIEEVARTRRIENPFGQIRLVHTPMRIAGKPNEALHREMWNWKIQSSATRILRRAMRKLHSLGAPIILEHHDALKFEVLRAEVPRWVPVIRDTMEASVPEFGGAIFPVEVEVGPSLGELEVYHA